VGTLQKIERLLAHRRIPLVAAVVAVLLVLPALWAGLFADDLTHQVALRADARFPGGIRGDWDIFSFQGPDRGYLHRMMDRGIWPWWTAPTLRLAFFRPLTSLWHAFDYRVLAGLPAVMHAESIALYAGITVAAALLYRRLLAPAWVAGLAAILFAVDHTHSLPVAWLANRNALVAALFGFAALVAHDRARRDGDRRAAIAAPILYTLGLLGGEAAVGTLAYLAAHVIFVDEAPPRARAGSLVPFVVVTVMWAVVYKALGYGASSSGYYIDPGVEPFAFARAVALRMPVLLLSELAGPPAEMWLNIPDARLPVLAAGAAAVVALLALVMARVAGKDRRAGFCATGMLLSLVPVCATNPQNRLLLFSSLGAFGLIALFFARLPIVASRPLRVAARALAALFVLVHAVASPVALPISALGVARIFRGYVERGDRTLPHAGPASTIVIVNAPDLLISPYVMSWRLAHEEPVPVAVRQLAIAIHGNEGELERVDARTLAVTLRNGFLADALATMARGPTVPLHAGDVVEVAGMTAEIETVTADSRPERVRFRFDRDLSDPSLVWVRWGRVGFVPSPPPAVGEKAKLDAIDETVALLGTE
jgi:hypothetical protein